MSLHGRLSVVIPVKPPHASALLHRLKGTPRGADSPLHLVEGTHLARFSVVDRLPGEPPSDDTAYLLFSSWFDGEADYYIDRLYERREDLAPVWEACFGYDRVHDQKSFRRWILAHRIEVGFAFDDHELTVDEVQSRLQLRYEVGNFAVWAQGQDAETLQAAWKAAFPLSRFPAAKR
jgi:hypothetical protein